MIIPLSIMAVNWWKAGRDNVRNKVNTNDYAGAKTDLLDLVDKYRTYLDVNLPNIERLKKLEEGQLSALQHALNHLETLQVGSGADAGEIIFNKDVVKQILDNMPEI